MEYRNRGARCKHGMLIGVITCPGCQQGLLAREFRKGARGKYYVPSEGGTHVINAYVPGRARKLHVRGYTEGNDDADG